MHMIGGLAHLPIQQRMHGAGTRGSIDTVASHVLTTSKDSVFEGMRAHMHMEFSSVGYIRHGTSDRCSENECQNIHYFTQNLPVEMRRFQPDASAASTAVQTAEMCCLGCGLEYYFAYCGLYRHLRGAGRLLVVNGSDGNVVGFFCRYRSQLCKDGNKCRRPVCFFAHSLPELRTPSHTWVPSAEVLSMRTPSQP